MNDLYFLLKNLLCISVADRSDRYLEHLYLIKGPSVCTL